MKDFSYNRGLVLVIIVGLIAALTIGFARHGVEQNNRQVDMAIDYEGLLELAEREGLPADEVLAKAKEAGITSLAVYDTTFKKLNANGKATAIAGSEILANYHSGSLADPLWRQLVAEGKILGNEVYIVGHDARTWKELKEDVPRRLGKDRVQILQVGAEEVMAVKAHYESFLKMNIGMPTDEMEAVNKAGFYVLARPSNYEDCQKDDVEAVFARLHDYKISEVVFSGSQSLGANKALQATIDEMKKRDMTLGLIEGVTQLQFYKQDGMEEIAKGIGYDKIARVYSIPKDEQPKLKIATAVERWSNTDEERNIRVDLLRIYDKPSPNMSLMETNMKYFQDTHDILTAHGYTIGPAATFADFYPSKVLRALVMAGVAAAAVLYLSLVIPALNVSVKKQWLLFAVFALCAAVPVLLGNGSKIRVLAALASANLFPAIAVIFQLDRIRYLRDKMTLGFGKMLVTGVLALFVTGALSYVGAAYLSASLADTEYLLEFQIFRGIKLTFVLPLILVGIAFLQRFDVFDGRMDDTEGVMNQMKKILDMPVKIKTLFLMFLVLIAGVVFVARSGHTSGMPVSATELKFRAFLEQAFYARPRTKELMIGHPAFMLAVMAFWRKWPTMIFFGLVLIATIGQGSMVETFAHMRTPVYMSFMRGIGGIVLGAGIGAVAMMLVQLWQTVISRAKERKAA
ncbi:DUF5693 family protein [Selenomonas ruminantium]|uniref:Uncharacterized protein n=1 Tax=Selenomonas ruminantium TaxID=971 RepID=A0A1H0QHE5_SELRU|nr:DUF5693 family protein [Selenomonas ruminantium]SDP16791.1 hypothetical protein SAMN05216366_10814 [Selenomonas ruminantium]